MIPVAWTSGSHRWFFRGVSRAIQPLSFVGFGIGTILAAVYIRVAAPNDWRLFYDTALLLVSGRTDVIYPGVTAGYPFLYPPPFLWHVAWLGFLSPGGAHIGLVLVMVTALLAALWLLHRGLNDRGRRLDSWIFVVLSSASWFWLLAAGHIAAWFVLLVAGSLLLWTSGREFAAGLVLGLLAIKPHYCLPVLLCVVLARAWRVLAGALIVVAMLALSTLPLGGDLWTRYFVQFGSLKGVVTTIPPWKQITLLAFWRSVFGDAQPWIAAAATALTAAPCIAVVGLAWIRKARTARAVPRLLGLTVLMLLSCNAYAFHYDGLLLTIPGAVWYLRGHEYANSKHHLAAGVAIFLAYVAQHASTLLHESSVAWTGPVLAVWLIIDGSDLLASRMGMDESSTTVRDRWRQSPPIGAEHAVLPETQTGCAEMDRGRQATHSVATRSPKGNRGGLREIPRRA